MKTFENIRYFETIDQKFQYLIDRAHNSSVVRMLTKQYINCRFESLLAPHSLK